MSQHDRRAIPRVDYAALKAGRSPTALNTTFENARSADALNSPSTMVQIPTSQVDSHESVFLELELLRAALATAKAENKQLLRNSELRDLQSELSSLQQQNALLRQRRKDPPPSNVPTLSVQDLREIPGLTLYFKSLAFPTRLVTGMSPQMTGRAIITVVNGRNEVRSHVLGRRLN